MTTFSHQSQPNNPTQKPSDYRFPSPMTMCTLVKMTTISPLEHIRDTRLQKEWLAVANTPAKSSATLTLMKLKLWTPFTQCFHIMREVIKIFKHYDIHHEYILNPQSEQSMGSPSTLLLNCTAPNWRAPCSTQPPLPQDKTYI
jgi:hypothetical protein